MKGLNFATIPECFEEVQRLEAAIANLREWNTKYKKQLQAKEEEIKKLLTYQIDHKLDCKIDLAGFGCTCELDELKGIPKGEKTF